VDKFTKVNVPRLHVAQWEWKAICETIHSSCDFSLLPFHRNQWAYDIAMLSACSNSFQNLNQVAYFREKWCELLATRGPVTEILLHFLQSVQQSGRVNL
jgi:hypothetical protein